MTTKMWAKLTREEVGERGEAEVTGLQERTRRHGGDSDKNLQNVDDGNRALGIRARV